jgi:aminopeptidase YwaD
MERFFRVPEPLRAEAMTFLANQERLLGEAPRPTPAPEEDRVVYRRNPTIKGPLVTFGYNYFTDHYGVERAATIRLLNFQGLRGAGSEYAYETLNFVDGKHTAREIRDAVSAIYGPVPLDYIRDYLRALEEIQIIQKVGL